MSPATINFVGCVTLWPRCCLAIVSAISLERQNQLFGAAKLATVLALMVFLNSIPSGFRRTRKTRHPPIGTASPSSRPSKLGLSHIYDWHGRLMFLRSATHYVHLCPTSTKHLLTPWP